MIILALDTATLTASAALLDGDAIRSAGDARADTHSEQLLPLLDRVLAAAGLAPADVDAVACGAGPGSFTGLRIGLATAKGLCFALGRPLVLVSSLATLAFAARGRATLALLDARKKELYAGIFDADGAPLAPERVLAPERLEDYVRAVDRRLVVVGDGAAAYPAVAARAGDVLAGARPTPDARALARLAAERLAAGEVADLSTASPTYIRASEAEIATPPVRT
jgi:tRNA threonylcarbamoyladenosine biosynthesis protein TsaB